MVAEAEVQVPTNPRKKKKEEQEETEKKEGKKSEKRKTEMIIKTKIHRILLLWTKPLDSFLSWLICLLQAFAMMWTLQ